MISANFMSILIGDFNDCRTLCIFTNVMNLKIVLLRKSFYELSFI